MIRPVYDLGTALFAWMHHAVDVIFGEILLATAFTGKLVFASRFCTIPVGEIVRFPVFRIVPFEPEPRWPAKGLAHELLLDAADLNLIIYAQQRST
jgi:hypothetical protein